MAPMRTLPTHLLTLIGTLAVTACSSVPPNSVMDSAAWLHQLQRTAPPSVLLLGEQHDAAEHQQWQQATTQALIERQQLAAVVLEMADHGRSTQDLAPDASETEVQQALQWNDQGWPWKAYGPTVMTAVRAGVTVAGGNLPRAQMKTVMAQTTWDTHLPTAAWERQRGAIRTGHCNLLPENQITPMARIQLAKDAHMAQTAVQAMQAGQTVVLIAGRGHVLRSLGIPTWLPAHASHHIAVAQAGDQAQTPSQDRDVVVRTPAVPEKDHCAALQSQWG